MLQIEEYTASQNDVLAHGADAQSRDVSQCLGRIVTAGQGGQCVLIEHDLEIRHDRERSCSKARNKEHRYLFLALLLLIDQQTVGYLRDQVLKFVVLRHEIRLTVDLNASMVDEGRVRANEQTSTMAAALALVMIPTRPWDAARLCSFVARLQPSVCAR